MKIAIIPARGGSKRIPRKNIKKFNGVPIINYSIRAALESRLFDQVFVTTDDQEIADVAISAGAEVPFMRDKELANDHAGVLPVMQDAIIQLGVLDATVCCIYATAPLLRGEDLMDGDKLIRENEEASW